MKKVSVVGIGISAGTITYEASEVIRDAQVLIGAPRVLEIVSDLGINLSKRHYPYYLPKDTVDVIESEEAERFAVLVSGDVGFYSAATELADALAAYNLRFIPGISTVNAFFAKLKIPWQDAALTSFHGREVNIVDTVRRNHFTLCLTGNNVNDIGTALDKAGFGQIRSFVGENLGTDSERVYQTTALNLAKGYFPSLSVLMFQNDRHDSKTPTGLPDDLFLRLEGIPMTKREIRAIVMSAFNLNPSAVCYDIGAGTGSVTAEMALSAYRGHVFAIERRENAVSLIQQNCMSLHIGNVTAICGEAPSALKPLPMPNAVFIGGSGGQLENITEVVLDKNPNARIVITAVTLDTISEVLSMSKNMGLDPDIIQVNIARTAKMGDLRFMRSQNPITVFSFGGKTCAGY